MITNFLTQDERTQGARMLVWHSFFNGLGFGFLAETIIYLLALQFDPTNTQLGFISSAVHIAGLVLLFLPRMTHEINLRKLYFAAWTARGAVSVFYLLLLFTDGQPAVMLILGTYSLFCVSRIIGVSMAEPVQQMMATSETRGRFIGRNFLSMQTARLLSQILSFALTSFAFFNELGGLLILIGIGITANTISALFLLGVPFREKSQYRKSSTIAVVFMRTIRNREQILVILIRCLSLSSMVLLGFIIPFLRVVLGLPQNMIFLYSVVGSLGMLASSLVLRPFVDSVGSKPLLLAAFLAQAFTLGIWGVLGSGAGYGTIFVLGFITTFLQAAAFQLVARLVLNVIPAEDKVSFMSLLNFISALFAFASGIAGGRLIDIGEKAALAFGSSYSLTFASGALISTGALVLVLLVNDTGSLGMREAANILFSLRNLKTFMDIYNFHLTENPVKKQNFLTSINYSAAPGAEPELRQILNNPVAPDKEQILISLYKNPRPRLLDLIIREAENGDSTHRATAIFALGAYPLPRSAAALARLYRSGDPRIAAAAAKSLARIGEAPPPEELEGQLFTPGMPTRVIQDLMVALSVRESGEVYLRRLFSLVPSSRSSYHQQAVLALAALLEGFTPALDIIYARENEERGAGLDLVLEEARSFEPFLTSGEVLRSNYRKARYEEIHSWCTAVISRFGLLETPPARSIVESDKSSLNDALTLGSLYYLFQLLNSSPLRDA